MRRWPCESTARATRGSWTRTERADRGHRTGHAVFPVIDEISRTVLRPNIDIGIRPMTAAAEKRQAPGICWKISAYGRSGRVSRPAEDRLAGFLASSIPVISRIAP